MRHIVLRRILLLVTAALFLAAVAFAWVVRA